jgi:catechol 2,3-dioxygenase-like lactoylglutathione lyase family enzyme
MPVPFNIVGIDHVVLRAADPTKLERFYLDALGLTFEKRQGELAQLRAGNALIDIVPADEAGPAGGTSSTGGANLDHLCLRIEGVPASFNWSPATGTLSSPARAGAKVGRPLAATSVAWG